MQLDRSLSEGQDESRNTSFLERTTIVKLGIRNYDYLFPQVMQRWFGLEALCFLLLMFIYIEKDEAELR